MKNCTFDLYKQPVEVFYKKLVLKIFLKFTESTCAKVSFLITLQAEACNFIKKEILAQVFYCEFYKISKNTYFTEHLWVTTSGFINLLQFLVKIIP